MEAKLSLTFPPLTVVSDTIQTETDYSAQLQSISAELTSSLADG